MSEKIQYTLSGDTIQYQYGPPPGEDDTYVDVVIGLDATPERRTKAAIRARGFFGAINRTGRPPSQNRRTQRKRKSSAKR
jgi:hypothetical protein